MSTRRRKPLAALAALAILCAAALLPATPAQAATDCGGRGERACCALERVPSCDKGLDEVGSCAKELGGSKCACGKGPGSSIGVCKAPHRESNKASDCGGPGERACCIAEKGMPFGGCEKGSRAVAGCDGNCTCGDASGNKVITGAKAITECKAYTCGKLGGKPCPVDVQISQRRASCDAGLAEDFIAGRCVKDDAAVREAQCRAVIGLMRTGKLPEPLKEALDETKRVARTHGKAEAGRNSSAFARQYTPVAAELQRIYTELEKVKDLFTADTVCVPRNLDARLAALGDKLKPVAAELKKLLPEYKGHFHMAYTLNAALNAGPGIAAGYAVATDYKGGTGVYVYLGPSVVVNASLGDSIGVQFYPVVTLDSFEGWGFGFGVSGGPPSKIFSGGMDIAFDDKLAPVGIGISAGIGLGALPVDIGVSGTYAWKLWSSK
jgi:hypothetical protein